MAEVSQSKPVPPDEDPAQIQQIDTARDQDMDLGTSEPPSTMPAEDQEEDEELVSITITHHGHTITYNLPADGTLADLSAAIEDHLSIPTSSQKLLIPKLGLRKPPFPSTPTLSALATTAAAGKKIQLLAPTKADLSSLAPPPQRPPPKIKPAKAYTTRPTAASTQYTFQSIRPHPALPSPAQSQRFLAALAADRGIRTAMAAHRFRVGLLTELDPAAATQHSHEGTTRLLGLNQNKGEAILLRLHTDDFAGYRDYRTVRRTLCHELAHNVHGEHDAQFWALTREIEREVEAADWERGGNQVGGAEAEFYNPEDAARSAGESVDGGGWTGGSFVLGGGGGSGGEGSALSAAERRDRFAKAAEERMRKDKEEGGGES